MSLLDKLEKFKKSQEEKTTPEPERKIEKFTSRAEAIDLFPKGQEPKKLKIGSADLDLLSKSLDRTTGFDISNVDISQDDLWLLYRLKFGKGTRNKRSILLPQFTEAFKRNLAKMKK
ncbi:hypothetical protein LCGC14_0550010 [marine sediment metagenome]|uniref:Uncharacterized protein n=1 Tax=marine sediment metagenome TaxID=412755 RepID=A0A0F9RV07_9ZZZZ